MAKRSKKATKKQVRRSRKKQGVVAKSLSMVKAAPEKVISTVTTGVQSVVHAVADAWWCAMAVWSWLVASGEAQQVKLARAALAVSALASITYVVLAVVCMVKVVGVASVVPLACMPLLVSFALLSARV